MDATVPLTQDLDCDLCIIGAGYAALNGLNAAAKYLKKGDRVVVIDKNETWGGQWTQQYDFVRLHQPYRMFTAGDQPWKLDRDRAHLATRREVLDHLGSVPAISAGHLDVQPLFRHEYRGHRLRDGRAIIRAAALDGSGTVQIRARRLLKAFGANIQMLPAFPLSSNRVRSVGVSDPVLASREFRESEAPVYVIGSGKTAMDAVLYIARNSAHRRPIHILVGSGMAFWSRDFLCPTGISRFTRGTLAVDVFLRMCDSFNGHNEADVLRAFEREGVAINVFGEAGNHRYGLLSLHERAAVRAAVQGVFRGHLVDVDGTTMTVREQGKSREVPVAEGSWFVNCTSHLYWRPHEPVLQDSGIVCAPQFTMGFSGASAYYLTHLWFRDELTSVAQSLYRIRVDVEPKLRFAPQMAVMVLANMSMAGARLPLPVALKFRGDNNRWFPLYRRLAAVRRVVASQPQIMRKAEQVLSLRFSDTPEPA